MINTFAAALVAGEVLAACAPALAQPSHCPPGHAKKDGAVLAGPRRVTSTATMTVMIAAGRGRITVITHAAPRRTTNAARAIRGGSVRAAIANGRQRVQRRRDLTTV